MVKRIKKRMNYQNILKQLTNLKAENENLKKLNTKLNNKLKASNIKEYKINYQYCPKKIYLNYDKSQYKRRIRKANRKINEETLKEILNNLNSSKYRKKSKPEKHVNKIINNKIGDQIDETKFLDGVKNSINNINNTWPSCQIKLLKSELNKIDYSNFNFDDPLSNLKAEAFIDLLLTPSNNFKIPNSSIKIFGIKNCTKVPLMNGIKFMHPKLNKEILFNKDFIKRKISKNIGILNSFYKMLQKFTNIEHLDLDELIKKINDMIDKTRIYFCDMPINTCGMTISNGDIYISGDYLHEALGETKEYKILVDRNKKIYYKFTAICKIYLTLLHEFSHKLHYLVRTKCSKNDEWKDNFFDHSEEVNTDNTLEYFINSKGDINIQEMENYTNLHSNKILEESGDFFDRELYLGDPISNIDNNTCDFFLCERCSSYDNYIKRLKILRDGINNKSTTRAFNSKFKIIGNSSRCYFSILRNS